MGSVGISQRQTGKTAEEAFDVLHHSAGHEDGYGGYSGSFGQIHGFVMLLDKPVSYEEAQELYRKADEEGVEYEYAAYGRTYTSTFRLDKRGSAGCVELLPEGEVLKRIVELDLPILVKYGHPAPTPEIEKLVKLKDGERIVSVDGRPTGFTRRAVVEATEGKPETRYFVKRLGNGFGPQVGNNGGKGYESQAAARAALTLHLKRPFIPQGIDHDPDEYEIYGVVRRVGGQGLVVGRSEITRPTSHVRVTIVKHGPRPKERPDGMREFFFFARAGT